MGRRRDKERKISGSSAIISYLSLPSLSPHLSLFLSLCPYLSSNFYLSPTSHLSLYPLCTKGAFKNFDMHFLYCCTTTNSFSTHNCPVMHQIIVRVTCNWICSWMILYQESRCYESSVHSLFHSARKVLRVNCNTFKTVGPCLRPYHVEHTSSRPITEVKQHRAKLVLGWVTAWEYLVL